MRFAIVLFHLSKVLRLPRKSDARSYEVLHLSRKIASATRNSSLQMPTFLNCYKTHPFLLAKMQNPLRLPHETTSEGPKVLREWCDWLKPASRHNGVHFFDISISKSAPRPSVLIYTGSFYRGSQDGKTCRFTWKSFTSNSWGKSETGLPGQPMQKNWPWISYMEVAHQICQ